MARDSKSKRRQKRLRRARNRLWEAYGHAWFKVTAAPFKRRQLLGLGVGRNLHVRIDLDETPVPMAALDPARRPEALRETHEAIKAAERRIRDRGVA